MARVLKDSMMRFAIEITRSPKWVQCIIRDGNEVAFKRLPLNKTITDAYYHTDEGAYMFDQRWEEVLYPEVPAGNERGKVALADLTKVINSFLNGGLPVTDKAERMLRALRIDPTAVEPLPSAEQETDPSQSNDSETNEDDTMSKKTKVKKEAKVKGYKGLRAGSNIEKLAKYHDEKKPERADFLAYAKKHGIGSATTAWQFIKNGYSKKAKS